MALLWAALLADCPYHSTPLLPLGPLDDVYATAIRNCDADGPLMM